MSHICDREHSGAAAHHTFAETVAKWRAVKERTASPSSLLRYDMALNKRLLPKFGNVKIRRLTAATLGHDGYIVKVPKNGRVRRLELATPIVEHMALYRASGLCSSSNAAACSPAIPTCSAARERLSS